VINISAILVIFAFGLVITGVVYLGLVQAREQAEARMKSKRD
jgi:hypothetical protein